MGAGEHAASAATNSRRGLDSAIDWLRRQGRRAHAYLDTPRGSLIVLAAAMFIASVVYIWLTRGTTFWIDELYFFAANKGFDPKYLLTAHNGQLIWFPRLIYAAVFDLFGPNYVVIRLVELAGDLIVSGLVYSLVRRRLGPAIALAPAILLLFFGSAWGTVLPGTGIINVYCVAAGLGAMLALEAGGRYADPLAALLLLVSLGCWSPGIAFAVGAGVLIVQQGRGWGRLWVAAVPLGLFVIWWATKPGFEGPLYGSLGAGATNIFLIPNYIADSISSAAAAVTGLDYGFNNPNGLAGPVTDFVWGPALAVLAALAAGFALRRERVSRWPWQWFAVLVVFWASAAIGSGVGARTPSAGRYVYVSAVVLLVVTATIAARYRPGRRVAACVLGVAILALGANIRLLDNASPYLRTYAESVRADFSAIEIARANVPPHFIPSSGAIAAPLLQAATNSSTYLAAVDRNGSFADTLPELQSAPEFAREEADQIVAQADGVNISPGRLPAASSCTHAAASPASPPTFKLSAGRAALRLEGSRATVTMRRFGTALTARIGRIAPDRSYVLSIPADAAPHPWWVQVAPTGRGRFTVCTP